MTGRLSQVLAIYADGAVRYTLAPPLVQGPDTAATPAGALEPVTNWRIVHQHESTPFYMDGSFTAAVDLTP